MDDELDDTAMRPRQRIAAPSGLSFEDTIMRSRVAPSTTAPAGEIAPPPMELYGFRMSGSEAVIVLDRPAYIGRKPSAPRIPTGFPPRLVTVESPRSEVSGSHIEVRQLGSTVVVTDLNSTNGSMVVFPGQDGRALRRGESMVVTPGTLVDIGDGNVVEILPLHQGSAL
jgi:FHA domain